MPRAEGQVWQFFTKFSKAENGKICKVGKCNFCGTVYVSNATRMINHLKSKCANVPDPVKELFRTENDVTIKDEKHLFVYEDYEVLEEGSLDGPSTSEISSPKKKVKMLVENLNHRPAGPNRMDFSTRMFNIPLMVDKNKLDTLFSQAVYASGTPVSLFENHYWKIFFQNLQPAYMLPNSYELSAPLLNLRHDEIHAHIVEQLNAADSVTLMSDGWTDGTLVSILFATPVPVFWSALDKEDTSADNICSILSQAICEVGETKVHAVVTDNSTSMKAAWGLLKQKFPHLITYGCCVHGLGLLLQDILAAPPIKQSIEQCKEIVKFFSDGKHQKKVLIRCQMKLFKRPLVLYEPGKTKSVFESIESLIKTQDALKLAIADESFTKILSPTIRRNIMDDKFWTTLLAIAELIKIPTRLMKEIQMDKPNLSNIPMKLSLTFEHVQDHSHFLHPTEEEALKQKITERKEFLCHPVQLVAHLLNPKLREDEPLDEESSQKAMDFIWTHSQRLNLDVKQISIDVADYIGKSSIWSATYIWEAAKEVDAVLWWKCYCQHRELTKLAVIILSLPAYGANAARESLKSNKYSKRLTSEQVNKLTAMRYNLQSLAPKLDVDETEEEQVEAEEQVFVEEWPVG